MQFGKNLEKIKIVEVGPRDGLQNESMVLDPEIKKQFIEKLLDAGIKHLEVASFVDPKAIPQMNNVETLYPLIAPLEKKYNAHFYSLVPNMQGMTKAFNEGCSHLALFTSPSDTFNKKNQNATYEEIKLRLKKMLLDAQKRKNVFLRGYVSMVFGCPFEGRTNIDLLKRILEDYLIEFKVDEVSLGDTIGVATPNKVYHLLKDLKQFFDLDKIAMHMHDTRAMALPNILASLEMGIKIFDSSCGGIGGCPYAKGATGNVATEDLVYMLDGLKLKTGIHLGQLVKASDFISQTLNRSLPSRVYGAFKRAPHLFKEYE